MSAVMGIGTVTADNLGSVHLGGGPSAGWDSLSWEAKRGAVMAQALFVCEICSEAPATEVDHIWPRVIGGTDRRDNLRASCRPCNRRKGETLYSEDIAANPDLARDGVRDAHRRAVQGVSDMVRWQIYQEGAAFAPPIEIDAALAESRDQRVDRISCEVVELVRQLVAEHGPVSGEHAATSLVGDAFSMFLSVAGGDDGACPDDPDGVHHIGCGCDDSDVFA